MRPLLTAILLGFSLITAASENTADSEVLSWLERMGQSHHQLSYQGIVTYQVGEQLSSFRVRHWLENGQEHESLEPLDGQSSEVHKQRQEQDCEHTNSQLLRRVKLDASEGGLHASYQLSMQGDRRQAGREAVELLLQPKDSYRYGYRMVLDADTGLMLRNEILSLQGDPLERFQFVMLDIDTAQIDDAAEVLLDSAMPNQTQQADLAWQPTWLPAGFKLSETATSDLQSQSYTDGLAVISIFIEPLDSRYPGRDMGMRHGASVSYSVAYPDQQVLVTVVGEVPLVTVREVAHSMRWSEK
ncbi:MucB/RseB C-terminal domain-containing protein [Spongiibacter sp. KMU-158]|uniref:MucB/RseB C-terminal domain-containing protein n=1 Tax=Spongiibacter pelagi TaxID=2760804 RepID=A0A927GVN1_9GAMM|nr:MucB/RseB C-terminal domain-containing protein [Spongiibacter pelagi]MBD2858575.1 MucB/RseB C-terminal domain-containing protein [Spongiibacter pelagi]